MSISRRGESAEEESRHPNGVYRHHLDCSETCSSTMLAASNARRDSDLLAFFYLVIRLPQYRHAYLCMTGPP